MGRLGVALGQGKVRVSNRNICLYDMVSHRILAVGSPTQSNKGFGFSEPLDHSWSGIFQSNFVLFILDKCLNKSPNRTKNV
jgi:hypothetical protein